MARSRLGGLIVLSLVLVLAAGQTARSDDSKPTTKPVASPQATPPDTGVPYLSPNSSLPQFSVAKDESVCRIYSLREMSQDPNFGKWVAETIPEVIQPGSWSQAGGKYVLRYNASTGILVVYHTQAAHAQVDEFLKNVKRSLPQGKEWTSNKAPAKAQGIAMGGVVPANYSPADSTRTVEAAPSKSTAYPIPPQAQQPKHLFHFIIRYEGDGIIDSTVAGVLKQLYGTEESMEEQPAKKKKKKSDKSPAAEQSSAPTLDQLFHLIVRYEGEGIIDSTVADVLKAIYSGSGNNNTSDGACCGGIIRGYAPASGKTASSDPFIVSPPPAQPVAPSSSSPTAPTPLAPAAPASPSRSY